MRDRLGVLAAAFRNPTLVRLEFAYLTFSFGEWATWVAVIVFAYGRGGAPEAGVVAAISIAPVILLAPVVSGFGDRHPRARVLFAMYALQAILMAATALALLAAAPAVLVYALATACASTVAMTRPIHSSLLPEVVASPDELTAANVVTGLVESLGSLLGPLGAGLIIAVGGPEAVFVVSAVGNLLGCLAVAGSARRARPFEVREGGPVDGPSVRSHVRDLLAGLAAIRSDRRLASVVAIAAWATFLIGCLDILYAVLAIDVLDLGESWVGYLGAAAGVGATIGSAAAVSMVGRERLALALGLSCALYGLPVAVIAVVSGAGAAAVLLLIAGIGSGLTYVAANTLIQRLAGDDVMSRVFGILESVMMTATAAGTLAAPILIALVGDRLTIALVGVSLPLAFVVLGRAIRAGDRLDPERVAELRLLRGVGMLGPLSAPVLERLAASLVRVPVPAGATVIRAGDVGDRFFVVATGEVSVAVEGEPVRGLGPGEGFGEIALVRDVPRTATVTATTDATLLALDREPFLAALTGQPRSRSIAADLAAQRLADDRSRG
jgi:MFS family permease